MDNLYNVDEINFSTILNPNKVIEIAEEFIKSRSEPFEIKKDSILYNKYNNIVKEAVWYVDIIDTRIKERWPDAYMYLAISDAKGKVVCLYSDHGRPIEYY